MNSKNTRLINLLGVFMSFFLLAFVTTFLFAPVIKSHADTDTTKVNLSVGSILQLGVADELNIEAPVNGGFISSGKISREFRIFDVKKYTVGFSFDQN